MLEREYYLETYQKFIEAFGEESELRMCIEEMSELTKELCKYMRYKSEKNAKINENNEKISEKIEKTKQNIVEECADVLICADQIKNIFGASQVEEMMDYKIKRGRKIVDEKLSETSSEKIVRSKK